MIFYSKTTKGFYSTNIHGNDIPPDSVEITNEYHMELIDGQSTGKIISADESGYPILSDPSELTGEELINSIKNFRKLAYMAETDPLFFKIQRGEATLEEWLLKIQEIKDRFPYPL